MRVGVITGAPRPNEASAAGAGPVSAPKVHGPSRAQRRALATPRALSLTVGLALTPVLLLTVLLATVSPTGPATAASTIVIKLGTIAPEGSLWHDALLDIRERWLELSDGTVELRIYAGGVLGSEDEMVRKMQRRGLDALAISGSGLPLIESSADCLNLPLVFDSYEELNAVREELSAELEARFEERGFKVLSWAEAGWVRFFATKPVRTPDELAALRLWISSGDVESERLFKALGFQVVPLPVTDMLTSLQTGLLEAFVSPPLFALLDRSYQVAGYMTDLDFAPLNAATVMTAGAWNRVPEQYRPALLASAREVAIALRAQLRESEDSAIAEMVERGLEVVRLTEEERALWYAGARDVMPKLGCNRNDPALFERVMRLTGGVDLR
jgi:TRAP-type C4-dicarboxylate transport system substrate-binding protein